MSNPTAISDIERTEHDATFGVKKIASFVDNGDGTLIRQKNDPTAHYKITDLATGYYGYTDAGGAWYIMQLTETTARYAKGDSDYGTAWSGKEGLQYDYFYNVF